MKKKLIFRFKNTNQKTIVYFMLLVFFVFSARAYFEGNKIFLILTISFGVIVIFLQIFLSPAPPSLVEIDLANKFIKIEEIRWKKSNLIIIPLSEIERIDFRKFSTGPSTYFVLKIYLYGNSKEKVNLQFPAISTGGIFGSTNNGLPIMVGRLFLTLKNILNER